MNTAHQHPTPRDARSRSVADGSGAGSAASLLVAWLLIGLVAGVLAVARRRVVAPLVVAPAAV